MLRGPASGRVGFDQISQVRRFYGQSQGTNFLVFGSQRTADSPFETADSPFEVFFPVFFLLCVGLPFNVRPFRRDETAAMTAAAPPMIVPSSCRTGVH